MIIFSMQSDDFALNQRCRRLAQAGMPRTKSELLEGIQERAQQCGYLMTRLNDPSMRQKICDGVKALDIKTIRLSPAYAQPNDTEKTMCIARAKTLLTDNTLADAHHYINTKSPGLKRGFQKLLLAFKIQNAVKQGEKIGAQMAFGIIESDTPRWRVHVREDNAFSHFSTPMRERANVAARRS